MATIEFEGGEGGGWEPLPKGTYQFMIQATESGMSKKQNPQLKVSLTVEGGESHGKKATDWFSLLPQSGWKLRSLLAAAIPGQYEEIDTGKKDEKDKPVFNLRFDTDDLIGKVFECDVSVGTTPEGKAKNDFQNFRAPGGADATPADKVAASQGAVKSAAAAPAAAAAAAAPAARRRVTA